MAAPGAHHHFDPTPGYCNWATVGVPARSTVATLRAHLHAWETGRVDGHGYDVHVQRVPHGVRNAGRLPAR